MRRWVLILLVLVSCKKEATQSSIEAEAMDWVRIVAIAAGNVAAQQGPLAPMSCRDPMLRMKKPSRFLVLEHCHVEYKNDYSYQVVALFNSDVAIISDPKGTRRVSVRDLPVLLPSSKGE